MPNTPTLEDMAFDIGTAAHLAGVTETQLSNWMYRDALFRGEGAPSQRGVRLGFSIREIFMIAAIRGLIEDAGLSTSEAVQAIRPYSVYIHLLQDTHLVLSRNDEGRWVGVGNSRRAEIHVLPYRLWEEMLPRWKALRPVETEAHCARLEALWNRADGGD